MSSGSAQNPFYHNTAKKGTSGSRWPKTLIGILHVLHPGCRWQDITREYGSPTTWWRRLKGCGEIGT
jgi:transposase